MKVVNTRSEPANPSRRKFSREVRVNLMKRTVQLVKEHRSYMRAAEVLNKEGFTTPRGQPISGSWLGTWANNRRKGSTAGSSGLPRLHGRARRQSRDVDRNAQPAVTRRKRLVNDARALSELVLQAQIPVASKLKIISVLLEGER